MARYTRGEFLGFGAALAGAYGLKGVPLPALEAAQAAPAAGPGAEPDLIVVNAKVYTVDGAQPRAEAFAVKNGRFVAVGSTAEVRNLATARTQVIDAQRMTITPGFMDCHTHASGVNELYGVNTNLRTVTEIQAAIRKKAQSTPPGFWITGYMFDDTKLDRALNRRDLDAATTDHPVSVNHRGGHTSWYNSKALELAGVTKDTADPPHGRFFRDPSGDLTGRVAELARNVFQKVGNRETFTPQQTRDRGRAGMKYISEQLTAAGLTSIHDAGAGYDKILAYQDSKKHGELRHRVYMMVRGTDVFNGFKAAGIHTGFGDEWVRVGGVKFAADGSLSERTMRMSTPYVGTDDYGILTMTQDEIYAAVDDAHSHDFQIGIHANGDTTIDMVLKAYERALAKWPDPDRRHRIEHCSLLNPDLLTRIKKLNCIPTPFWTYVYFHGEKFAQYGDEKMRSMMPHRWFLDYGIKVAGASDYGPGPYEPLMALQSMVTRKDYTGHVWGENQKVTVDEGIMIATMHGAYASFEEATKGSITAGKLADFVVLEQDPHDVDPDQIMKIKINRTVVGGKTMYPKQT
ncbi:MAG: amidohydrolase [Acidobacteria bacterium]|nr:amidohydrolase [Acidobacteriota bacterium]